MTTVRREPSSLSVGIYTDPYIAHGLRDLADKRHVVGCKCDNFAWRDIDGEGNNYIEVDGHINACTDLARALVEFTSYTIEEP